MKQVCLLLIAVGYYTIAQAQLQSRPYTGSFLKLKSADGNESLQRPLYLRPPDNCPPLPAVLLGYTYQGVFKSGITAEFMAVFPSKKCTDCSGLGALCYLLSGTAGVKTKYFPSSQSFDISPYYGYKNWAFLPFGKIQVEAGYSFVKEQYGGNFFHVDPSLSLDLLLFYLSFGYTFRTVKFDNKVASPFFSVAISPSVLGKSSVKRPLRTHSQLKRSQRKQQFKSL